MTSAVPQTIDLEGVRVHNLKNVDLKLPLHQLIVISGVSGSGKSSLAIDTLYAEGQRRYIESFSAYARQFLDRLEKPDADRIDRIPPAIAIRQQSLGLSAKATIATATELHDYFRLLFAKIGRIVCPACEIDIRRDTPSHVDDVVKKFSDGTRFQVCFPLEPADEEEYSDTTWAEQLQADGFVRVIIGNRTIDLRQADEFSIDSESSAWVVIDRLVAGKTTDERIFEAVENAFQSGNARCLILEAAPEPGGGGSRRAETPATDDGSAGVSPSLDDQSQPSITTIDDRPWRTHRFSGQLVCEGCGREFVAPEPRLFSFNTPLGACPNCSGFGTVPTISLERLVPDPSKTLREGAIAAWTTPAYRHELEELLDLADDHQIPVDVPFSELSDSHIALITDGVAERNFGGLNGFFSWLERNKYKLSVRVFLNRWRDFECCPDCQGTRLQPQALAVKINDRNIADVCRQNIDEAAASFQTVVDGFSPTELQVCRSLVDEIQARLGYLLEVGLEYLSLDRTVKTLSVGEARRIALTAALGSTLVNTLYVLDEPSAGLHPRDSQQVIGCIRRLCDARNTVVVVEHEDAFVTAADEVVEIGPGAGKEGGHVVFQGTPEEMTKSANSITGAFLSGRRSIPIPPPNQRRIPETGWLTVEGARLHNLKNITVKFPLGVLCAVTGVSGSGKSSLVEETLFPAICRELGQSANGRESGDFDRVDGVDEIDQIVLVDQTPVGRTRRSNAMTYMKVFDVIRNVFADTPQANLRNFTATHFSFNASGGGRCPKCSGSGSVEIDMQFLADVSMTCPECHGTRYQREILEVKYRGLNIAEVLKLTVREAFVFFRGRRKLQKTLSFLKAVGLEYLPLGQPTTTLSGGESQRLKLASFLASKSRDRTLFLIDEPTTGLHAADVARLLDCFNSLLAIGHSLVVIEHNLDVVKSADYVIDLGPEAGAAGGELVACGTPEEITSVAGSITGRYLRKVGVG